MSNEIKHENERGGFEHQDLQSSSILYFLLSLVVATVISMVGLRVFYHFLDARERATQEAVNPLVKQVPEDTRHVGRGYPETAFPSPRLEEDERGQLEGILTKENQVLYSYGWVDEKGGIARIPIDRAMDLLVQRGLPVLPQGATGESSAVKAENSKRANAARGAEGKKQ